MLVTYEKSLNGKEPRDGIFPFHSYSMLNNINRNAGARQAVETELASWHRRARLSSGRRVAEAFADETPSTNVTPSAASPVVFQRPER